VEISWIGKDPYPTKITEIPNLFFCHPKIGIDPFGNIRRKIAFHTKTIFDVLGRIFGGSPKLWLCPRKQQSPDQITRIPSHVVMLVPRKGKQLPPGDDMTP
jgi:hypothetical protein